MRKDKGQDRHRILNSLLIVGIFLCSAIAAINTQTRFEQVDEKSIAVEQKVTQVNNKFNELSSEQHRTSEISQLMVDEGFRKCVYKDSLELRTIGFGHLMLPTDKFKCLTYRQAVELLRKDYDYAANSVDSHYPWAYGEVRLVLINMTYQMGQTGVSKFKKTLANLQDEVYDEAAVELLESRWARQTEHRALRLAGRIMSISVQEEVKHGR